MLRRLFSLLCNGSGSKKARAFRRNEKRNRSLRMELLESRRVLTVDAISNYPAWGDTNNDGWYSPIDALNIVNTLGASQGQAISTSTDQSLVLQDLNASGWVESSDVQIMQSLLNSATPPTLPPTGTGAGIGGGAPVYNPPVGGAWTNGSGMVSGFVVQNATETTSTDLTNPVVFSSLGKIQGIWSYTNSGGMYGPLGPDTAIYELQIDWNDGSPLELKSLPSLGPSASTGFEITHLYKDDNPTSSSYDSYTVTFTLLRNSVAVAGGTSPMIVYDAAPSIGVNSPGIQYIYDLEGNVVDGWVEGVYSDPSVLDTHKLYWRWGEAGEWQSKEISGGTFLQHFPELGLASFRLTPTTLLHLIVEDDDLLTAQVALAPPQDLNIAIFDGQYGDRVPEDVEDTEGAVTVANLNDTDADGIIDNVDDGAADGLSGGVVETRSEQDLLEGQMLGRNEVDLMRLVIYKPKVYSDGDNIDLIINNPNRVKLWYDSSKRDPVGNYNRTTGVVSGVFGEWGIGADSFSIATLWVEITDKSTDVGDISIRATLRGAEDKVVATGVWAELTETESRTIDWESQDVESLQGTIWDMEMDQHLQEKVGKIGGTGLQQTESVISRWQNVPVFVFDTVILFQWTIYPANVCDILPRVQFDNARQVKVNVQDRLLREDQRGIDEVVSFPQKNELPNDEIQQPFEESGEGRNPSVSSNGHMYGMDSPYIAIKIEIVDDIPSPFGDLFQDLNALEFLRVGFKPLPDGGLRPSGNAILGSITSPKVPWLSKIRVTCEQVGLATRELLRTGENRIDLEG